MDTNIDWSFASGHDQQDQALWLAGRSALRSRLLHVEAQRSS